MRPGWLRALLGLLAVWARRLAQRLDRLASAPAAPPSPAQIAAARRLYPDAPDHWLRSVAAHLDEAEAKAMAPLPPEATELADVEEVAAAPYPIAWFTDLGGKTEPARQSRATRPTGPRARLRFPAPIKTRTAASSPASHPTPVRTAARFERPDTPPSPRATFADPAPRAPSRHQPAPRPTRQSAPPQAPHVSPLRERALAVFPPLSEHSPAPAHPPVTPEGARVEGLDFFTPPAAPVPDPVWPTDARVPAAQLRFGPTPPTGAWPPLPPAGTAASETAAPPLPDLRREQWSGQWNA